MVDKVTLHGSRACHYARKVESALISKGVKFEFHEEECKKHSHKTCTVLVHKKEVISGSHKIIEYVEKKWQHHGRHVDFAGCKDGTNLRVKHDHVEKIFEAERRYWCVKKEDKYKKEVEIHGHLRHRIQVKYEVTGVEIFTKHKHPELHGWYPKLHKHEVVGGSLPPKEKHINRYKDHYKSGHPITHRH